jgi:signal peptidase II
MTARVFRLVTLVLLALGLFGCDHATKLAAKATLEGAPAVTLARGALELRYTENDDIAFSAFHQIGVPPSRPLLVAVGVVAVVAIAVALFRSRRRGLGSAGAPGDAPAGEARATSIGLALVLGGAFGNLVDRVVRGYVVDFIHVRGWPVFNVADIAVVVGIGLLAIGLRRSHARASP